MGLISVGISTASNILFWFLLLSAIVQPVVALFSFHTPDNRTNVQVMNADVTQPSVWSELWMGALGEMGWGWVKVERVATPGTRTKAGGTVRTGDARDSWPVVACLRLMILLGSIDVNNNKTSSNLVFQPQLPLPPRPETSLPEDASFKALSVSKSAAPEVSSKSSARHGRTWLQACHR